MNVTPVPGKPTPCLTRAALTSGQANINTQGHELFAPTAKDITLTTGAAGPVADLRSGQQPNLEFQTSCLSTTQVGTFQDLFPASATSPTMSGILLVGWS